MERSEQIDQLATALAAAQGEIENALKDSSNPFFKSAYADLASVWNAVREPLSKNGLAVIQLPSAAGSSVTITTILSHKSGQFISSDLTMTAREETPQAIGSCITYARRYALQSVAGVAPEDDDAEGAEGRKFTRRNTPEQQTNLAQHRVAAEKQKTADATPKELKPFLDAIDKDMAQSRPAFDHMFRVLSDLGADGLKAYDRIADKFQELYPSGCNNKEALKSCISDLYHAYLQVKAAPKPELVGDRV